MKYSILIAFLLCYTLSYSQNNNNPTIAVCNGNQYVCATGIMSQICVNIIVDPSYPNINFIDHFEIKWGDGSVNTIVPGSTNPPSQQHTYDLTGFYGTCTQYQEYDIKLLTHHNNGALPANNSFTLTFINPPIAQINISDMIVCLGQSTTISDASCPIGFYDSNWTFGDGTFLNDTLFSSHTYTAAGNYTITHSVTNQCGSDSETATVSVLNLPVANIQVDSGALSGTPAVVCLGGGGLVRLDASISLNATSFMWSVTPSTGWEWWPQPIPPLPPFVPTGPKARIRFTQAGTYTIKIKVNNGCDMPSEKTIEIKVVNAPQLSLNPQPDGCLDISYSPTPFSADATYTINGMPQSSFPIALPISPNPYIVVASLSNECGMQVRRDTFNLSAPQNVTITSPASNLTVCTGSAPLNLAANPPGGSWSGPFISQSGGNFIFTPPGTPGVYTVKYTRGVGNCERSDDVVITVEQSYNLQLAPQPDGCNSISYSPSPLDPNVQYTINGMAQGTFPVNLPVSNNPYIIAASVTNTCGTKLLADTFFVVAPVTVIIQSPGQDTVICQNSTPVPLVANPGGGNWVGPGISGPPGNQVFNSTSVGLFPLIYIRGVGNCERRDTVRIRVEEAYNLQLAPQGDDCISLSYTPTPNDPNVQYTLNGAPQTTWPVSFGVSNNPNIVTASVTNACGTKMLSDTFLVVAPDAVSILAPIDTVICQNTSPLPLLANLAGGNWQGQFISGPTGNQVFSPNAAGTYPIIYIRGVGNCERRDTVTIMVEEAYNLQLAPQPDDCITLNYSPAPNDPNVAYTLNGAPQVVFPQTLGVAAVPYVVTATHVNVCGTKVLTDTFLVLAPTNVNILTPKDTLVCQNSGALTLSAEPPGGTWLGQNISGTVFNPAAGGVFPIIYTRGSGNCEKRDTTMIEVIAVDIQAGADKAVCLEDSPFALTNFNPTSGGTWTGTGISNPSGTFDPGLAGVGAHALTYSFVDPVLSCTFRDSMIMTVNPMPGSAFAPPSATCINEEIQFQNLSVSTFKVSWDFGDGQTSMLPQPTHTYTDTGTYTITLSTMNEFGCMDFATQTIFVTEPPFAFFTPMPDSGCAVLPVSFDNDSYGWQTTYNWQFGNLQTNSNYNPGEILLPGGTKDTFYIITLTATNLCAVRTWTDSILVHPLPIVNFGTSTDTVCNGATILFANTTLGQPETFEWDFGNGQISLDSLPDPVQYFTDSLYRTYTVRLISTNFCGADTFEHDITVKPIDVKAFFNVPNLIGCEPYTVQFSNFATPGASVSWDFGDGNTASSFNPQHTFQQDGTYKVVQKASSGCGYDSTIAYITVLPAPEVSFTCLPQICQDAPISFTNTSPDPLSGLHWDFGDGDTSILNNPTHSFSSPGLKTVVLTGISAVNGCPAPYSLPVNVLALPIVDITTDKPDGCVPLTVGFQVLPQGATYFEWSFGDGNTGLGNMPDHTFYAPGQYEISLVGIDVNGCRNDTILRYITVHPIPTPAFTMQRDRLCGLPVLVDFVNNTPDAVGYTWTFGDGPGSSVLNNPQHSYTLPGDYLVQLIAENAFMCRDTTSQVFSAYAQPVADFAWDPEEGCAPLTVVFENLSTFATSAKWLFSDGGVSDTLAQTSHTFYDWGKHSATLIVSHREVCFDTLALTDILEVFPSPTANFSFEEIVTDPPSGMFEFKDLSLGAVRWQWVFGDGDSAFVQNPSHRFYSNGQKLVQLTVWGENGCPDDTIRGVTPLPMHGLFMPNAFTPGLTNGDADLFQPKGVGLREFEIAVYSSFGQLLWSSGTEDLNSGQPGRGWDGNFKGVPMPQDVYTWQIRRAIFDDGTIWGGKKIGSVTLIR